MVLCDKIQSPLSGTSWGERDRPPGRWGTAQAKAEALWSAARAGVKGPVRRAQGPHCLNVSRCGGRGTRRSYRFVREGRGRRGAASHQKRSRTLSSPWEMRWAGRPRPPSHGPERSPGVGVCPRTLFPSRPSRATGQASCVQARRAAQQHLCRSVPDESTRMTAQHSEVNSHQPQPIGGQITCSRALQGVKASSRKWLSKTRSAQGA